MRPPLFVLGMHRSGTSVITGTLQRAGFSLGPHQFLTPADAHNESGYYELHPVMEANERIRKVLGMHFNQCLNLPEDWQLYEKMPLEVARLAHILNGLLGKSEFEALKDPRISLLLPVYREIYAASWSEAGALICVRNPQDVATSLAKRDFIPERSGLGMWLHHTLCILRDTKEMRRRVVLYQDFLEDPVKALTPILSLYPALEFGEERKQAISESVRKQLNHGRNDALDDLKPNLIGRTYDLCARLAADPSLLDDSQVDGEIETLWEELMQWWTLPPCESTLGSAVSIGYLIDGVPQYIDHRYQPQQKPQTLLIDFEAPKGDVVAMKLSDWPGTVWIRSAVLFDENRQPTTVMLVPTVNVVIEETPTGMAWNLMVDGVHCTFKSMGGKQQLALTLSSWIDTNRVAELANQAWAENLEFKKKIGSSDPSSAYAH